MDGNGSQLNGGQRDDLAGRISRYGTAIATLQQDPTATTILAALLARDSVEDALQGLEPPAVSETAEQLMALLALDQQLKQQATVIYATVDLAAWQKSFHPPETAWWWYLSEPVHRLDRHDWLWNTLTVIALTASGSLLVDISGKFLTGGPGLLGSFTVLSQSVMTVATAGGVLTQQGRRIIEQAIASLGIKRPLWQETKLGLSLLLLAVLMGFRSSLPQIAAALTNRGEAAQESGDYSEAETAYKRAIALDKDNVQARYKLGVVYDDLARPEAAEEQFLFAVNDGYLPANNDLALLYLENDEPDKAAALLTQALEQIEDSPTPPPCGRICGLTWAGRDFSRGAWRRPRTVCSGGWPWAATSYKLRRIYRRSWKCCQGQRPLALNPRMGSHSYRLLKLRRCRVSPIAYWPRLVSKRGMWP
jgi:tetratricopeptide (TPR) repeat protein